jgi:hypothetical protein
VLGFLELTPWLSLSLGVAIAMGLYYWLLRRDENMKEILQIVFSTLRIKK